MSSLQKAPALPATSIAPHGAWTSPITSAVIVGEAVGLDQIAIDDDDIFWIESRPREQGRCVPVRWRDGCASDLLAAPWNVRTRVHEYGGGAYVIADDTLYFSQFSDQRLYRLPLDGSGAPQPVSSESGAMLRYADSVSDHGRNRLIAVREDHRDTTCEAVNLIVAHDLPEGGAESVLVQGSDFFAAPRLSPDGRQLAWLSWNHPDMPWDGTCLWLAAVAADGSLGAHRLIAGGRRESIFQPSWSPQGELHFVSDRSGWWNLYRWRDEAIEALQPASAEFGRAQWNFGMSTYGFEADGNLICSYVRDGQWHLARLDAGSLELRPIPLPFRSITDVKVGNGFAVILAGAPDTPNSIVRIDLITLEWAVLRRTVTLALDPGYLSIPEAIEFPTAPGLTAHALFYAPKNRDFTAPAGERAPLLVISHGGPTSTASATLNLSIQFWTSRGFAVVDVNYGGSTGYGRDYRERLYGQWGVVDVEDAIAAARWLVGSDAVDGKRLAIRGSSAGGYTTLAALTFHDYFTAGASYYGVSDLEALARDCHKFESRYLDHLIGPYPAEQSLYRARSPIHFVDCLSTPLILFQGLQDKVVPPNQSQAMFDALKSKGLPVAYLTFEEEQHGFRQADNIRRALEAELYFYARVFDFNAADTLAAVDIVNLPST
ncbi:MAG: S9 family peptidase [Herminiimonas sp.]|nr:S9 family peptidase [Herminiimonas sp.]